MQVIDMNVACRKTAGTPTTGRAVQACLMSSSNAITGMAGREGSCARKGIAKMQTDERVSGYLGCCQSWEVRR